MHFKNFETMDYGSFIDYVIGVLLALVMVILPIFILVFYCKYFNLLDVESFKDKFGTVYEGLNNYKRSSIMY